MNLADWLQYIAQLHAKSMDLGLTRIKAVAENLGLLPFRCPVVMVTGTNGKGSCVAALEQIYLANDYKVGAFTSPHLWRINEEIRLNGLDVSDDLLVSAFNKIEHARGNITLTLFEFSTLAALILFQEAQVDMAILEVGLGGRLDAVNIVDADLAIMSSIGLDHQAWLGHTRAEIALEKAGIFRVGKPAVCGDASPPAELNDYAKQLDSPLYLIKRDFNYQEKGQYWDWQGLHTQFIDLPIPSIDLSNAATALMAVELMQNQLAVSEQAIKYGLKHIFLPGRYQVIQASITQIFDVGHNPQAAIKLASQLKKDQAQFRQTHAVFSMLADKDIAGTVAVMKGLIDTWHIAKLDSARAAELSKLETTLTQGGIHNITSYVDINTAYQAALSQANAADRIVIFGSFYTVAATLKPMVRA